MAGQDSTGPTEIPQLSEVPVIVLLWGTQYGNNHLLMGAFSNTLSQPLFLPSDDHSLIGNSPVNDLSLSMDLRGSETLIGVLYWCILTKWIFMAEGKKNPNHKENK